MRVGPFTLEPLIALAKLRGPNPKQSGDFFQK